MSAAKIPITNSKKILTGSSTPLTGEQNESFLELLDNNPSKTNSNKKRWKVSMNSFMKAQSHVDNEFLSNLFEKKKQRTGGTSYSNL